LSVQQTSDGGYIVAGSTTSFGAGDEDLYLVKTSATGETLWTRTYGGTAYDVASAVQQTTDGGYMVAGSARSFGGDSADFYLVKTDAAGDTLWTRTYGGAHNEYAYSAQQTLDGGYVIAGYTTSASVSDFYVVKTDAAGSPVWTRTYGGISLEQCQSIQQTADSGYVMTGQTYSFGNAVDVYLVKTNALGDTVWTRTYGGSDYDWGYSVRQTSDGGYIVAGWTMSFGSGGRDVYLIKTGGAGETLWTRTYGWTGNEEGRSVRQTPDGGYVVAGLTSSFGAGGKDAYLIKTDSAGDTIWTAAFGGANDDDGVAVQQTSDGGYVIAGTTNSFGAESTDVYLVKTDPLGNVGVAEKSHKPQAIGRKLAATVVRSLPQGTVAFDATGRRVLNAKPGVYFLRSTATAAPSRVLLVK
jgi:hypothetical protein